MDTQNAHEEIRKQQRDTWNKFSPGWKKWEEDNNRFTRNASQGILEAVRIKDNDRVLDFASGTGEPGLSVARMASNGGVVLTDISEQMLAVARENAERLGLHNVEIKVCSADALPFPDNSFDAVTGRFGFMFFPDIPQAAGEIYRVLKPGGMLSTAVWSTPDKNPFATVVMGVINRHVQLPPSSPDAPGMFRCGKPGFLTDILKKAGFGKTTEHEVTLHFTAPSIDEYWGFMTELAAPVVAGMAKADEATKKIIREEVYQEAQKFLQDGQFSIKGTAVIVTGVK